MTRIRLALALVMLALLALWLATGPLTGLPVGVWAWRPPMLQGTGSLAIGLMSVSMVLATRPMVFERWLGGLDKSYRLHKWLGVSAVALAVAHWLWVEVPKGLAEQGWLARGLRPSAEPPTHPVLIAFHALRDVAEGMGEWAFYALVLLIALALWKRLPYRRFFQLHRVMPVVYLVLVFHAVVLTKDSSWSQPLGVAMAVLMLAGTVAALVVLSGRVGRGRQVMALLDSRTWHAGLGTLELAVRLQGRWPGHAAGQFAFLRFDAHEGAHPFTIVSPWLGDGRLVFLIKGLGDYTKALPGLVDPGDPVRVEGPYGQFQFQGPQPRQIWVGGGIGITPFIARLQQLALRPDGRTIDLFHTTSSVDEAAFARLRAAATAAGVTLHLMVDAVDGRLTAARLCAAVADWQRADVWFCGPASFGRALRRGLLARGLPGRDFHQELFELR